MNKWNDIFRRVDCSAVLCGYNNTSDVNVKKQIITDSLKLYLLDKMHEMSATRSVKSIDLKKVTVEELIDMLGELVPEQHHFDTMRFITHYLTAVSSSLQGWEIVWPVEDNIALIDSPMATFNEQGKWDTITTHEKTSYTKTAQFAYEVFKDQVLVKKDNKCLLYRKEQ